MLGKDAPNLSPAVISRLTAEWQGEYERWQKRDLSARRYVYVWADGVFLQARMEDHGECMLVLIGATPEGKKELIGFQVGVRESAQSWRELLVEVKSRGLDDRPGNRRRRRCARLLEGARRGLPGTRHQRCWVHKTANVLNKVALSVQTNMKKDLREIYLAPNRASAEVAIDVFAEKYGAKYDKAVECLTKDREALLALLRLPCRALGSPAHDQSHRKRVCDGPAQDGTHERLVVANHRQADGLQAALRGIKDLAASQRHKSVAEGHRRCQIRRRHRGHRSAGKPRRLIASSPKIPHSSWAPEWANRDNRSTDPRGDDLPHGTPNSIADPSPVVRVPGVSARGPRPNCSRAARLACGRVKYGPRPRCARSTLSSPPHPAQQQSRRDNRSGKTRSHNGTGNGRWPRRQI